MPAGYCFLEIQWAEALGGYSVKCFGCSVIWPDPDSDEPLTDDPFPHKPGCPILSLEAMERDSANIARYLESSGTEGNDALVEAEND